MEQDNLQKINISSLLLRIGIGIVFVIFGYDKLVKPYNWLIFLPQWVSTQIVNMNFTYEQFFWLQGIFEIIIGVQLILGIFTKFSAITASLILFFVIYFLGFSHPIALRDMGILVGLLAIVFMGSGNWALDHWLELKKQE